jgi:hypothetical protein
VAEANFSAAYGYDVRGEVFGSKGMVAAGSGARNSAQLFTSSGWSTDTVRSDTELMRDAYTGEFVEFARRARGGSISGGDSYGALLGGGSDRVPWTRFNREAWPSSVDRGRAEWLCDRAQPAHRGRSWPQRR